MPSPNILQWNTMDQAALPAALALQGAPPSLPPPHHKAFWLDGCSTRFTCLPGGFVGIAVELLILSFAQPPQPKKTKWCEIRFWSKPQQLNNNTKQSIGGQLKLEERPCNLMGFLVRRELETRRCSFDENWTVLKPKHLQHIAVLSRVNYMYLLVCMPAQTCSHLSLT